MDRRPILFIFFFRSRRKTVSRRMEPKDKSGVGGGGTRAGPRGEKREKRYEKTGQAGTIIRALPS